MKRLIIWGATGQARVLRDALPHSDYKILALFDNRQIETPFPGIDLFVGRDAFLAWHAQHPEDNLHFCVAIGGSHGQERLELQGWLRSQGLSPLSVVHPRAYIAETALIGAGSQILAMSAICANATLGQAVIINTGATVDHDCVLGNGVHIAPGAHVAGEVHIDDYAFVGMGALILPRVRIGHGAIIGAGSVVTKDVPEDSTVVGSPARTIRPK